MDNGPIVNWERLTPPEFDRLAKETGLCILPIAAIERHGEHLPLGTDVLIAEATTRLAAQKEPCVVFPVYRFGQIHEAACFTGALNLPQDVLCTMLAATLDQIAQSGFKKILIVNAHGGNGAFLDYFALSRADVPVDYTLYITSVIGDFAGPRIRALEDMWESGGGHADEHETSMIMAIDPDTVKMDQQRFAEPIEPVYDLEKELPGVKSGMWWYALYPEHVNGCPSKATAEKGRRALEAIVDDLAETIGRVKKDTLVPALQKEFFEKMARRGKHD